MFKSFFMGGFECATGYNRHGHWMDQIAATGHDTFVDDDYRLLTEVGIHSVREAVRWPLVDQGKGRYDFSSVKPFVEAARRYDLDVVWDLFHYGFPDDVDLFSGEPFVRRFADYCYEAARYLSARTDGVCYFTPVNEPSFFAFAGGEGAQFAPFQTGRGWDLKVELCRAAIAGIDAIRAVCPSARMVNADPLCHVALPPHKPEFHDEARDFNDRLVYQAWDMIAGRILPELGGSRDHLDIVGINYYWTGQWEWRIEPQPGGANGTWLPSLANDDPRRVPLSELIRQVYTRYGGDLMISETSHQDEARAPWLREVGLEVERALQAGIPLAGVCIYPVLGMPEWHDPKVWAYMGLWDPHSPSEPHRRIPHDEMIAALRDIQRLDALHAAVRDEEALIADLQRQQEVPVSGRKR